MRDLQPGAELARHSTRRCGPARRRAAGPLRVCIYKCMLELRFEWDPAKSDANLRRRGFSFRYASLAFAGPVLQVEDARRDHGERRMVAIGMVGAAHLTVVYTDRTSPDGARVRRIIAAWRSSRRERATYSQAVDAATQDAGTPGLGAVS